MILPDRHRAAALRLAHARLQQAAGRAVWQSPTILTWEAWLAQCWRAAVLAGRAPAAQLLGVSQERALWEAALTALAAPGEDAARLTVHAPALMRAATRATQSLLALGRVAVTPEEQLLVQALAEVRAQCRARGLLSLGLAPPEALQFLAAEVPPLVAGVPSLTPLQQALRAQVWDGAALLLPAPAPRGGQLELLRAANLEAEFAACAAWCRARLEADPTARLLVAGCGGEHSLQTLAGLLWRELAPSWRDDEARRHRWLAVEGGEPLAGQGLVEDALAALDMAGTHVETRRLATLLESPAFDFGATAQRIALRDWLAERGIARWSAAALRDALHVASTELPAAVLLLDWLEQVDRELDLRHSATLTEWAGRFSAVLDAAGFGSRPGLDSRQQQRRGRWGELLDELAGLDAVLPRQRGAGALLRLRQIASQAQHQAASGDAAITLSDQPGDPVIDYDGIWIFGLTESRWPAPPRPDPYVPVVEQRRCAWPEAGVTQRRAHAQWALACWQGRTAHLVISYPEHEADLHHRPSGILPAGPGNWRALPEAPAAPVPQGQAVATVDAAFPALSAPSPIALPGGVERLRVQRDCPFRAQAQWRLGAEPPPPLTEGVTPALRGRLLHTVLERIWERLGDQSALLAQAPEALEKHVERAWQDALQAHAVAGAAWLPEPVLRRERLRALQVVSRVLELERARAPFAVEQREQGITWEAGGALLRLRLDRVDRTAAGERVLVDYKSGAPDTIRLQDGELAPLQLALYVVALAARGEAVDAAALLSLKPGATGFAGVARTNDLLPRLKTLEGWDAARDGWREGVLQLVAAHLAGEGRLAADAAVCRQCHLDALCRRTDAADVEAEDG